MESCVEFFGISYMGGMLSEILILGFVMMNIFFVGGV